MENADGDVAEARSGSQAEIYETRFGLELALSAFTGYTHNDKDISNRVSVVETQQRNDGLRQDSTDKRLQRIEDKVDRLLERVK